MKFSQGSHPISKWAEADRPREKLIKQGPGHLTNAELMAILLGSGSKHESALDLGRKILASTSDDLHKLSKLTLSELQHFKGVGLAKAVTIRAALELGKRKGEQPHARKKRIGSSRDVFDVFRGIIGHLGHEEFWVLSLDQANNIKKKQLISRGGVTGTVADPKLIFRSALEQTACSIILVHNHPSGNLKPSEADKLLTRKIASGGEYLEIRVLDHLIVHEAGYFSFADEGLI